VACDRLVRWDAMEERVGRRPLCGSCWPTTT
jgi:hypothetical protein